MLGYPNGDGICPPADTEAAKWTGRYEQKGKENNMNFLLNFSHEHKISGGGSDVVGDFDWIGSWSGKNVNALKKYRGKHTVIYSGSLAKAGEAVVFSGTW